MWYKNVDNQSNSDFNVIPMDQLSASSDETSVLSMLSQSPREENWKRGSKVKEIVTIMPDELQRWRTRDMLNNLLQHFQSKVKGFGTNELEITKKLQDAVIRQHLLKYDLLHARHSFDLDNEDRVNLESACQHTLSGQLNELFDLVLDSPRIVYAKDSTGSTLLHHAIDAGSFEIVRILLSRGADPNAVDGDGNYPVHLAVRRSNMKILQSLLQHGAQILCSNKHGVQPIHLACETNFVEGLKYILLSTNLSVNTTDERGSTPVHYCCLSNSHECLQLLLHHGADIYKQDAFGSYPIHVAIFQVAKDCVRLLFDHEKTQRSHQLLLSSLLPMEYLTVRAQGDRKRSVFLKWVQPEHKTPPMDSNSQSSISSNVRTLLTDSQHLINLYDGEGYSPIHMAVNSGDLGLVQICLDRGANCLATDKSGHTAVHFACTRGDLDCVKLLLNYHPNLKTRLLHCTNEDGRTILHQAAMSNNPELIEYLIELGADMDKADKNGLTPVLLSANKGSINACIRLIELGADVTRADENGRNTVMLLLFGGTGKAREAVPALAKTGKMTELFNHPDKWGCTFLHIAARLGFKAALSIGLRFNGDVLRTDIERSNPLHSAARFGRYEICNLILQSQNGIRALSVRDQIGRLPLHIASQYGHNRIVELFLRSGCLIRRCHDGNTPLHYAAMNGNPETCSVLLSTNRNLLDEKNYFGMTALHFAAVHKNGEVAEYLLTAGAEILPDQRGIYFTTHLLNPDNYLAAKLVAAHKRWPKILEMLRNTNQCPLERLVRYMPSLTILVMDRYVTECGTSDGEDHETQFDFTIFQPSSSDQTRKATSAFHLMKLMIDLKREELLIHPLCAAYLKMKWQTYGRWIQLLAIIYYMLLGLSITRFALNQLPLAVNYKDTGIQDCVEKIYGDRQHSVLSTTTLSIGVLTCGIQLVGKAIHMASEKWQYFTKWINCWLLVFNLLYLVNCILNLSGQHGPSTGVLTVVVMFMAWINILFQMLRYRVIGLFVIMFIQVGRTIVKTAPVFCSLFVAFAITFHKLLILPEEQEFLNFPRDTKNRLAYCFLGFEHLNRSMEEIRSRLEMEIPVKAFGDVRLAFFQTLMMMVGEYEHTEVITKPYLDGFSATIYTVELTFAFYAAFTFTMPISLMNLMIGLAVGDIDEVQRSATQQLIAQQVYWLEQVEAKFPQWLYSKIHVQRWTVRQSMIQTPRKPHIAELNFAIKKLREHLSTTISTVTQTASLLDQIVQQAGMGSYETQQDVGSYSDDMTVKNSRKSRGRRHVNYHAKSLF